MSGSIPAANAGQAALPVRHKGLLTLAVMGASIIQILDSTIANVALPHMRTSLGATLDTVTWVLTSYIIASAIAIPVTGWLSDRVGSRKLFLIAVAGFIFTSMLCGIATSLTEMVLFRVAQGVFGAFIGPLSQTVLLDINPPDKAPRAMAVWAMGIMVGPILGPVIGGLLTENYNWRWCFYINVPVGLATFAILWWLLPTRPITVRRLDIMGFAMLALGLTAMQLMLDRGNQEDWLQSWEIRIEAMVAIAAFWMFAVQMKMSRRPLFSREMLFDRNYMTALGLMLMVGLMMMALFALLPPMLQNLYGYDVIETGALLAPRGVGIVISMAIAQRLISYIDPRAVVGIGFGIVALSMWHMTGWSLEMDRTPILISGLVQGIGLGLTFMPMNYMAFSTIAREYRTDGSSLLYLMRNVGGSIGISICTTMLARNIQTSHEDMAGHVTAYSFSSVDPSISDRFGQLGGTAMSMLDMEINRQAAMISYLSDFKLMMIAILCFMPLIFLLKPGKAPAEADLAGSAAH